ncbi:hypothetical protein BKA69DRAFT_1077846 [Paraphysoderma sedebokerense]|nr:hypothetical protein BKA69DRAFT_1077846 [Paraphysoderma sedebokerense]
MFNSDQRSIISKLLALAFLFSLTRYLVISRLLTPRKSMTLGLSLYQDLWVQLCYSFPLFLASFLSLVTIKEARHSRGNLENTLFRVKLLFLLANIVQLVGPLVSTYTKENLKINSWLDHLDIISENSAKPGLWDLSFMFVFLTKSKLSITSSLGLSYEHGLQIHRFLGFLSSFWFSFHSIGYIVIYAIENKLSESLFPLSTRLGWINFPGVLAFGCLIMICATSYHRFRRRNYNLFYLVHMTWIFYIIGLLIHDIETLVVLFPTILLYLIDKIILYTSISYSFDATLIKVTDEVVKLILPLPPHACNGISPGQFMLLRVPSVSRFQYHPFSISAIDSTHLSFIIRKAGPWTKRLFGTLDHQIGTCKINVSCLGPISSIHLPAHTDRVLVIAGGVGIAKFATGKFLEKFSGKIIWTIRSIDELNYINWEDSVKKSDCYWIIYISSGLAKTRPTTKSLSSMEHAFTFEDISKLPRPFSRTHHSLIVILALVISIPLFLVFRTFTNPSDLCRSDKGYIHNFWRCRLSFVILPFFVPLTVVIALGMFSTYIHRSHPSNTRSQQTNQEDAFGCEDTHAGLLDLEEFQRRYGQKVQFHSKRLDLQKVDIGHYDEILVCGGAKLRKGVKALCENANVEFVDEGTNF